MTIVESGAIVKASKLFIGNDSGFTHIAKAIGIPFIAVIGGGMYGKFFQDAATNKSQYFFYDTMDCFGCKWNCIYDKPYCITNIKPADIFIAVSQQLGILDKEDELGKHY